MPDLTEGVIDLQGEFEISEARAFREILEAFILENFSSGWTLIANTKRGKMPVGMLFGIMTGHFLWLGDLKWYPWATTRNKAETIVKFVSEAQGPMLWLANEADKDFYVYIAKHGIARRVGTSYSNGRHAVFEVAK